MPERYCSFDDDARVRQEDEILASAGLLVRCPFLRVSTISPLSYTRLNNNDLVGFRLPIFQVMRRRLLKLVSSIFDDSNIVMDRHTHAPF